MNLVSGIHITNDTVPVSPIYYILETEKTIKKTDDRLQHMKNRRGRSRMATQNRPKHFQTIPFVLGFQRLI